ncbi:MAG: Fe-S cluster assembly ATPase SufC [Bacteroidales bacterium]|nr:Fe-S cluster assembly ATPase SufC [Bacteroidales bacterium]
MLNIKNLHVEIAGKQILKGLNLGINKGEVHAIMGPNGTGKSTLAAAITGRDGYEITEGEIWYKDINILDKSPDERANMGIFLSFQYPVEIPGVSMTNFMRTALNAKREFNGLPPIAAGEFLKLMEEKKKLVEIHSKLTNRSVNEGFSGGEKKRNEIFQMAMLEPAMAILDETDSGLDIDALRVVANGVNQLRTTENAFLVITHYQRLLDYIVPDFVHVLFDGRIIKTGGKNLALELEAKGYEWIKEQHLV